MAHRMNCRTVDLWKAHDDAPVMLNKTQYLYVFSKIRLLSKLFSGSTRRFTAAVSTPCPFGKAALFWNDCYDCFRQTFLAGKVGICPMHDCDISILLFCTKVSDMSRIAEAMFNKWRQACFFCIFCGDLYLMNDRRGAAYIDIWHMNIVSSRFFKLVFGQKSKGFGGFRGTQFSQKGCNVASTDHIFRLFLFFDSSNSDPIKMLSVGCFRRRYW